MRSWGIWLVAAAVASASSAFAESAQRKGGSSGGSSGAGASHHSGGGGGSSSGRSGGGSSASAPSSSGGGSSSSGSAGGSHSDRHPTGAQRRHPRAGTGTGDHGHGHHGHGYPYYYDPYLYPYYPAAYGYYGDIFYSYPPYHYQASDESPAVRVQVKPSKTRVYVDGYYAGVADDFDGIFQRLYIPRGRHEIRLKLEGHRTHRFSLYGIPGNTTKIRFDMVKGEGEDPLENLAGEPEEMAANERREYPGERREYPGDDEMNMDVEARQSGGLSLDIHPRDASVYIDGELYRLVNRNEARLAVGTHHLEAVRPGYHTFERDFEVRPGKTTDLTVELEKKGGTEGPDKGRD